ncbi:GTP binding [Melia azedarach]|uniref:GTP binding n=2 Tax=Melia azedarach TaxID=155640 RepID=A0ACC1XT25_MELAZ|nr:GTP binding [Melia azedarach]KAJ4714027.1 GTP binding [Melia azedarach]
MDTTARVSLDQRPGILIVGSSNVGKRTLLSRLLSVDFEDACDSSSQLLVQGWTIDTKYYTADVSVWMAHLRDGFSVGSLPIFDQLTALVMVFDLNELSTLDELKDWVSQIDLQKFEILLCIGNKVDLVPGHPVHAEYRRRLLEHGKSSADYSDFAEYGISETEGSSLLGEGEPSWEIRRSCLEWCTERNIEYVEACASNVEFDKCLSVDGDSQGIERLYGALSAHMWPGMILKSGDKITEPSLPEKEESSEEESDYEFDYEVLSAGSADRWDDSDEVWVSANETSGVPDNGGSAAQDNSVIEGDQSHFTAVNNSELVPSTSRGTLENETDNVAVQKTDEHDKTSELDMGTHFDFEDLEQLMSEIGNMRNNLRLMPDFQRREMAAKLAMKMATMFGGSSEDEEGI